MDEYIGIIKLFAGNFAPRGWAFCNGQLLPIAQYSAVFSILGTTYGGNGQTTFALPNLQSRLPIGMGQGTGLSFYTQGEITGTETVTLLSTQMPAHTHLLGASTSDATASSPAGAVLAVSAFTDESGNTTLVNTYGTTPNTTMNPAAVGSAGGSQPHSNMPPVLALNYIICLEGIYPSRN